MVFNNEEMKKLQEHKNAMEQWIVENISLRVHPNNPITIYIGEHLPITVYQSPHMVGDPYYGDTVYKDYVFFNKKALLKLSGDETVFLMKNWINIQTLLFRGVQSQEKTFDLINTFSVNQK